MCGAWRAAAAWGCRAAGGLRRRARGAARGYLISGPSPSASEPTTLATIHPLGIGPHTRLSALAVDVSAAFEDLHLVALLGDDAVEEACGAAPRRRPRAGAGVRVLDAAAVRLRAARRSEHHHVTDAHGVRVVLDLHGVPGLQGGGHAVGRHPQLSVALVAVAPPQPASIARATATAPVQGRASRRASSRSRARRRR